MLSLYKIYLIAYCFNIGNVEKVFLKNKFNREKNICINIFIQKFVFSVLQSSIFY